MRSAPSLLPIHEIRVKPSGRSWETESFSVPARGMIASTLNVSQAADISYNHGIMRHGNCTSWWRAGLKKEKGTGAKERGRKGKLEDNEKEKEWFHHIAWIWPNSPRWNDWIRKCGICNLFLSWYWEVLSLVIFFFYSCGWKLMNSYWPFERASFGFCWSSLFFFLISFLISSSLVLHTVSLLKGFNKVPENFPSIMKSDRF